MSLLSCYKAKAATGNTVTVDIYKNEHLILGLQTPALDQGLHGHSSACFYSPSYHDPLKSYWNIVGAQLTLAEGI